MKKIKRNKNKPHWTEKVGNKLGKQVNKVSEKISGNRKAQITIIVVLLAILFIFIVPIQNNIITLIILGVLVLLYYIIQKKSKL